MSSDFSFRSRQKALQRFQHEKFDILVIGGGITGAGVARDAASRGLKVALVEKSDFASGTSSRSSKLIHGGLRYLENLEFGLVFEALAERSLLLRQVPHMVRPLQFYLPVYEGDLHGKFAMGVGLWLYDLLAMFRAPMFHQNLSKKKMLSAIPFLDAKGLKGGYRYSDASMWDDVLAVETHRSASHMGAAIANYCEAESPIIDAQGQVRGFKVKDCESGRVIQLHAKRVIVCGGPWTDILGAQVSAGWKSWLTPSKGVHLLFDLKRIPVPGAMTMSHPDDRRVAFVIPRVDFGQGVVIVGTTDGPSPAEPSQAAVEIEDVHYLLELVNRYFPTLKLTPEDVLSAYVGVRPLAGNAANFGDNHEDAQVQKTAFGLKSVSREHFIGRGPGGTVFVAGGKYTTYRRMAEQILEFTLKEWKKDSKVQPEDRMPMGIGKPRTKVPLNPKATGIAMEHARVRADRTGYKVPEGLWSRYGAEALKIVRYASRKTAAQQKQSIADPDGFPNLAEQLRHNIRHGMVMHLEDFYLRRIPLFACRHDHGRPWIDGLLQVWAEEFRADARAVEAERRRLEAEIDKRSAWEKHRGDPAPRPSSPSGNVAEPSV